MKTKKITKNVNTKKFSHKTSQGEQNIINILNSHKIKFVREKRFLDLRKGSFRYDFFIAPDVLIEFDGEQHFKYNSHFYRKRSDFTKSLERDRRKNSYALANGYKLYRVPFNQEVNSLEDIFRDKNLVRHRYHNDYVKRSL